MKQIDTLKKAQKEHKCYLCGEKINKGEIYWHQTVFDSGNVSTFKTHTDCSELVIGLEMCEMSDTIDAGTFYEHICEKYKEIMAKKYRLVGTYILPSLSEMLKMVKANI